MATRRAKRRGGGGYKGGQQKMRATFWEKERGKLVEAKGIGEDWIEIGALSLTNSIVIARMLVNNDKKYRDLSILY